MPLSHPIDSANQRRSGSAVAAFYWYYAQRRYAAALAQLDAAPTAHNGAALWALYKLGLYRSVACSEPVTWSRRGEHARAVSLAACGSCEAAERIARGLAGRGLTRSSRVELADDLAPFLPELSLELVGSGENCVVLRAALQLRLGRHGDALAALNAAFRRGVQASMPELHLLESNREASAEPDRRLAHLNRFLQAHGLSVVRLRDSGAPPSPGNLLCSPGGMVGYGPKVSVLMTCFDSEARIGAALDSLCAQTYRDLEIIVVDDASGDRTREVVLERAARDSRIRLIALSSNVGTYAAKNIGLRSASGEFITCHDSDDWSHPQKIELQVAPLLRHPELVATTSNWVRMQDEGTFYARPIHPLTRVNPSSPLFRRQRVLEKTGAWDWVRTGADSEFAARLRVVFGRLAIRRVALPLAFGSHRSNSLVTSPDTGFGAVGIASHRLDYWEAWGHWHISALRNRYLPAIPHDPYADRPFPVSGAQAIDAGALRAALL